MQDKITRVSSAGVEGGTASRPPLGPPTARTHRSRGREHLGGILPHARYDVEHVRWRPPP